MNFPQLCYQFKDLVAFSVAEFEFDKNQAKPCLHALLEPTRLFIFSENSYLHDY